MATAETAIAVLAEAEARLRELVGQAAAQGDYDVAVRVAAVAKDVAALAAGMAEVPPNPCGPSAHAATTSSGGPPVEAPPLRRCLAAVRGVHRDPGERRRRVHTPGSSDKAMIL